MSWRRVGLDWGRFANKGMMNESMRARFRRGSMETGHSPQGRQTLARCITRQRWVGNVSHINRYCMQRDQQDGCTPVQNTILHPSIPSRIAILIMPLEASFGTIHCHQDAKGCPSPATRCSNLPPPSSSHSAANKRRGRAGPSRG